MIEHVTMFLVGWFATLSGVALGGWLVFRTKRESYEGSLFGSQPKGEVFSLDDGVEEMPSFKSTASIPAMPPVTDTANEQFIKQFAERMEKGL